MDHLTAIPPLCVMPPEAPLAHRGQDFGRRYRDENAPAWEAGRQVWAPRATVLTVAAALTAGMVAALVVWLDAGGLGWIERALIGLVGFTFFWISFGVATAALGLATRALASAPAAAPPLAQPLRVALLMPVHNERPEAVMGNAAAMLEDIAGLKGDHAFEFFVLSDSRDPDVIAEEERAFARLRRDAPLPVWYRRRTLNTDRKIGNLADWIGRWGGRYDALIVLDADSLMSAEALETLAAEMAADPSAGLIQSLPRLIRARTLFARLQQFSSGAYGWLLAEGLSSWAGQEGNYWGHNAIIRTRAFAQCAGLPRLRALRGEGKLILSHDFVEAGLLRRAGWAVRFLPRIAGSYEESPANLVEYALRDRRWCHGNLQHLRLLCARGFHPVSRFHLFAGAMAYLMAPAWFALLVIWAILGNGEDANVIAYFTPANPTMPVWPEISGQQGLGMLVFMYLALLSPKLMAAFALARQPSGYDAWGGAGRFWQSFALEIAMAVAIAPVLMIQQLVAVLRSVTGLGGDWTPLRGQGPIGWLQLVRFHALETLLGALLVAGLGAGLISVWLLPIAASLLLAVPLSWLGGRDVAASSRTARLLCTPEMTHEPRIVTMATHWRARMRDAAADPDRIAA
ncbi:glucosyltransferase MdoH [Oceaniovalibus guishaninsula JLT2003]|uniref:Glucans biosynthesis glucosyltransferase H n=1 Tax=Oceaniovalibus guishaninsula JLT2003 TaxID=1231392 RepID=K2GNG5_9RHOB|nr:glucans biosynthesis glucosyltransferase MdoH [Oceaniovalibus guishaninsula]EKE44156.1 glucosyltransferase MdoH [Oceaniovalibus guishaninsula JLT2003]